MGTDDWKLEESSFECICDGWGGEEKKRLSYEGGEAIQHVLAR